MLLNCQQMRVSSAETFQRQIRFGGCSCRACMHFNRWDRSNTSKLTLLSHPSNKPLPVATPDSSASHASGPSAFVMYSPAADSNT